MFTTVLLQCWRFILLFNSKVQDVDRDDKQLFETKIIKLCLVFEVVFKYIYVLSVFV